MTFEIMMPRNQTMKVISKPGCPPYKRPRSRTAISGLKSAKARQTRWYSRRFGDFSIETLRQSVDDVIQRIAHRVARAIHLWPSMPSTGFAIRKLSPGIWKHSLPDSAKGTGNLKLDNNKFPVPFALSGKERSEEHTSEL